MDRKLGRWKKIICLLLVVILTVLVTEPAMAKGTGFFFKYNDEKAVPGADASAFIEAAGDAEDVTKTNSCATKGYDYSYEYEGFTLNTYTEKKSKNATQYVSSIVITSSDVKTPEGITIGSKEKKVKSKYKKAKKSFGVYSCTKGKTRINITVEKKKVTAIEIIQN